MNKFVKLTAVLSIALTLLAPGFASAEPMMKTKVDYGKVEVMMKDHMELVPLRQVAESLGYLVTWDGMDRSVTLTYGKMTEKTTDSMMTDKSMEPNMEENSMKDMAYTVKIQIDSKKLMVGMSENMLSYAPVIINDKTYVTKQFIDMYLASPMMMK